VGSGERPSDFLKNRPSPDVEIATGKSTPSVRRFRAPRSRRLANGATFDAVCGNWITLLPRERQEAEQELLARLLADLSRIEPICRPAFCKPDVRGSWQLSPWQIADFYLRRQRSVFIDEQSLLLCERSPFRAARIEASVDVQAECIMKEAR
jgi:hypothetical protein